MKKGIVAAVVIALLVLGSGYYKYFGSADAQNKWGRKMIEIKSGDYDVTYATAGFNKTWNVRDGKITSVPEKGYYFFFVNKQYVQVPIGMCIIEEVE